MAKKSSSPVESFLFPTGIAEGSAFCNREAEQALLHSNIHNNRHTLIVSPRRYGKTSLVSHILVNAQIPYAYVQFFNAFRDEIVVARLLVGLGQLLHQIMPFSTRALQKIQSLLMHSHVSAKLYGGTEVEYHLEPTDKKPIDVIRGLLEDIKKILVHSGKKAVIFFDEFQDIGEADISDEFQSIVRDFVQFTKEITFIVSGSHRHMLEAMFDDRKKPFYKLFEKIYLKKIKAEHYMPFLQQMARKRWKTKIEEQVFVGILKLTECHPYYVNRLCYQVWQQESVPTLPGVLQCWRQVADNEFSSIASDLSLLTKNQRILLQALSAYDYVAAPHSKEFLLKTGLAQASMIQSLTTLVKKDFVEKNEQGYAVIDPLLKYILVS